MSRYPACLRSLVTKLESGTKFQEIDSALIAEVNARAQLSYSDSRICHPVHPMSLQLGQVVAFTYMHPDENPPFRIGMVNAWVTTGWNIFTLNLQRQRIRGPKGGRGKISSCGPGFRSYRVEHMRDVRIITGKMISRRAIDQNTINVAKGLLGLLEEL